MSRKIREIIWKTIFISALIIGIALIVTGFIRYSSEKITIMHYTALVFIDILIMMLWAKGLYLYKKAK